MTNYRIRVTLTDGPSMSMIVTKSGDRPWKTKFSAWGSAMVNGQEKRYRLMDVSREVLFGARAPIEVRKPSTCLCHILFGSYITAKTDPNDVDIILVMCDDFDVQTCDEESQKLFDYLHTKKICGASVFWTRPALFILKTLE